ncbi:hypothetical protein PAMA_008706 [Pampus argenteus]
MPLLCISVLALLLLPLSLSLSCGSKRTSAEIGGHYTFLHPVFNNTKGSIASLLQNTSCPELKHNYSCKPDTDVVSILHTIACKMMNLSYTEGLANSVLNSIQCPCPKKPTRPPNMTQPNVKSNEKRTATRRRRRNEERKRRREICKAKALLSTMTECYEMLNTILMGT